MGEHLLLWYAWCLSSGSPGHLCRLWELAASRLLAVECLPLLQDSCCACLQCQPTLSHVTAPLPMVHLIAGQTLGFVDKLDQYVAAFPLQMQYTPVHFLHKNMETCWCHAVLCPQEMLWR